MRRSRLRALEAVRRPWRFFLLTAGITYVGTAWMVLLHAAEGGSERNEPGFLVHVLRDGSLAVPAVAAFVFLAIRCLPPSLDDRPSLVGRDLERSAVVAAIALGAAMALAAGSPIHAWLFGAHHHGAEPTLLIHFLRDGLLALVVTLAAAGELVRLIQRVPADARLRIPSGAAVGRAMLALALLSTVTVSLGPPASALPVDPADPCPVGAPMKRFDVLAIDVDIPLNRFGDHDPLGKMYVLNGRLSDVRMQETSRQVTIGLRDDPIQPLVIRANLGDCVEIDYRNDASGGSFGVHIDGLAYGITSSGDSIGMNPRSDVAPGTSQRFRYYVPLDETAEGAHYLHPGPGYRDAVSHGLFGTLVAEPRGSTYLDPSTGQPMESGWEATIVPGSGAAFREPVIMYHEVGNEGYRIPTAQPGEFLPQVDPHTGAYRPGSRAMNYRSEPFFNRMERAALLKSAAYGSYPFGDPPTPIPRGYLGDPTKIRLVHSGSEMFHVHHLHGGSIRWRQNPNADPTYDYAATGLNKRPVKLSSSARLDSQSIGPGETYNNEIENGAGGGQQAAGDFLFHCHIASHYVAGMWSFWRVFNTRQLDLVALPDRAAPPQAVDSAGLIGRTMPDGTTLTASSLDDWIEPQLPPRGVPRNDQDATVWNWRVNTSVPGAPVYVREPDETEPWPNLVEGVLGHPGSFPGDQYTGDGNRSKILFDPTTGRPAYPLLRPNIGQRPPFSPNGHSGAPFLGEQGNTSSPGIDPYAGRADAICPEGSPLRRFNVVAVQLPIPVTKTATDPTGKIFVLAHDKADVLAGSRPAEPLAIRANIGDCVGVTLTSEQQDLDTPGGFAKVNMHIHHVQFDVQASDGVTSGMAFEQSVRPYKVEDPQLTAPAVAGATTLSLSSVAKFRPGVFIGVGLGTEGIEVRKIASVNSASSTLTLTMPLSSPHVSGEWAGTEFVQSRWYPDVQLDNIFWHDHVDGIHGWGHGLVAQLIIEPEGSTYHDPTTGEEVDSGTYVDIHTSDPLAPGLVEGSFRELALWTIDENPVTDSTLNLRAEPWADRLGDPSLRFSSYTHGDPVTPLPRAYPGDPFVIRTINVGPTVDSLHVDGHRFFLESRYLNEVGAVESSPLDTLHYGVSERFTLILEGGAGGPRREPGDYLYMNAIGRRFRQGAWGMIRVLENRSDDLRPLPGTTLPPDGPGPPSPTGGSPPQAGRPGDPCPAGAPVHEFRISAVDMPDIPPDPDPRKGVEAVFVPTSMAAAVISGAIQPEPLVMHVAAGECIDVLFWNQRESGRRASFHVGELERDIESSGINVGFNPEQTVAPGNRRWYRFYASSSKVESAVIADFGADDSGKEGLYGAVVVAPTGATFTDPVTSQPVDVGARVDVHVPGYPGYRDFTTVFADDDTKIGQSVMPYPVDVDNPTYINYQAEARPDDADAFSSLVHGDPATPIFRAYAGDPLRVHAIVAPGSEQVHMFSLGGMAWPSDPHISHSEQLTGRGFGPWQAIDAHVIGGAGGLHRTVGDHFYGDLRRPFTQAGLWGLLRVLSDPSCPIAPLAGLGCLGLPSLTNIDTIAPTVSIDLAPNDPTNDPTPSLEFSASEEDVMFECSLLAGGGTAFEACASPKEYSQQPDGTYTFKVRATDQAGNVGQATEHRFTIDTVAPTARANPPGGSYASPQSVTLSSSEPGPIHYTVDGTDPTTASPAFVAPIQISTTTTLKFLAFDEAGNASAIVTEVYRIQGNGAPTVTAPEPSILTGVSLGTSKVPVQQTWSGTDPDGIASYQLQRSTNGGASYANVGISPVTATTKRQQLAPGGTQYRYRVRATDTTGNVSAFAEADAFTVTALQESAAAIAYGGAWSTATVSGAYGGALRHASVAGRTATLTFTGDYVAWVSTKASNRGKAEVRLDGTLVATVDLFASNQQLRRVVFASSVSGAGPHLLEVRVLGQKRAASTGTRVDIDAFVVLTSAGSGLQAARIR